MNIKYAYSNQTRLNDGIKINGQNLEQPFKLELRVVIIVIDI